MKQLCEIPLTMLLVYKKNREKHKGWTTKKPACRRKQEVQEVNASCPSCVRSRKLVK